MPKMAKLEFENHKNQYFSWLLRSKQVKTNIFENRMIKLTIGLSLFDFKQLLVNSGTIVQWCKFLHFHSFFVFFSGVVDGVKFLA